MLSSFVDLGNALVEGYSDENISNFISVPKTKSNKISAFGIVEFNTKNNRFYLKITQIPKGENLNDIANRYRLVGNPKGNKPQWALTTSNLGYLLSNSIRNLLKMSPPGVLKNNLDKIFKAFYINIDFRDKRTQSIADLTKLEVFNLQGINLDKYLTREGSVIDEKMKPYMQKLVKEISKHLLDRDQEVLFWTVSKDGELLCESKDYEVVIKENILGKEEEEKKDENKGICSVCGRTDFVSHEDTKNLEFKYFITDKISFASDINPEGFNKNMVVCKSCLRKMIAAEKFLKNEMNVSIGGNPVYLIASIQGEIIERNEIEYISKNISKTFNTLINFKTIGEIESELSNYANEFSSVARYSLTLIFQKKKKNASSSDFKISRILEEIPDTRIETILRELADVSRVYDGYDVTLNLQKMYYNLQPIRDSSSMDKKGVIEIIASIIAAGYVSKDEVMKRIMENLRQTVVGSNFSYGKFCLSIAEKVIFIMFIEIDESNIRNDGGENKMDDISNFEESIVTGMQDNEVNKGIEFLNKAKYYGPQKGLFWLGYLSGKLMYAQYRRLKNQPLLDKIGFKGMNKSDLIQYDIELLEGLKNYDLFGFSSIQKIHYLAHSYIDRYLNDDSVVLTKEEIPFYILAGISYEYFTRNSKGDEEKDEEVV